MNYLIFSLGLLTVASLATCDYGDETSTYIRYLKQRSQMERLRSQFSSLCPGKDDELDEAVIRLKDCTDEIDENTETACSALKNHFLRCSRPLVQLLESCFPEESKDVPNLVFQAVNSGVAYLCRTDGEHIFELANKCFFKTNYRSMRCERRVRTKMQQYKNKAPTKSDICELAESMKPCLHNHLQDSCGNRITRESFTGLFGALTAPCQISNTPSRSDTNAINEVEILEK